MISIPKAIMGYLTVLGLVFLLQTAKAESYRFELWMNPVLGDFQSSEWQLNSENRFWSARIYGIKIDGDCKYVKGQKVTGQVRLTPDAVPFEAPVAFIDDDTPDSSRPAGYQDFGRWEFNAPNLVIGSQITVGILNKCPHRKEATLSWVGPFVITYEIE